MIDYENFLSRHDLVFKSQPVSPFDCPFMGNGSTGALLFFKENELYLNLGNTDVYDSREPDERMSHYESQNLFMTPRLPLGGFRFKTSSPVIDCRMRLSLWNAETTGEIITENGKINFICFVAQNDEAVVFEWSECGETARFEQEPNEAISPRQKKMVDFNPKNLSGHYDKPLAPIKSTENGADVYYQPGYNKPAYTIASKTVEAEGKKTFAVTVSASDKTDLARLDEICRDTASVKAEAYKFWHSFYQRSFLSLDDTMLEGFYWIQLYKCACSTRNGKRVFDTAGPWLTDKTAWPATWWNLNVELNYSPLFPSNHTDLAVSLPQAILKGLPELRENVPAEKRNGRFITIGRCTTSTLASRCTVPCADAVEAETEVGNLLWALHSCCAFCKCECLFDEIKGRFYEILSNAVDYAASWLYKDENGVLHMPHTCSPEYPGISVDCSYTLSLLRWGLITLVDIAEKYGINDAMTAQRKDILDNLADYALDTDGSIKIGADIPLSKSHRHYSHLLMFYPLHIFTEDDAERRKTILSSIEHWQSMPEGLLGYSQTGAASMYSVLGDGEKAYKHLKNLFGGFVRENTMYHEDLNPVLETPPAAARSMLDMLMLSFDDEIRLFNGAPACWQNVSFKELLSENGCLVSACLNDGKLEFVEIKAKSDCTVTLKIPAHLCSGEFKEITIFELKAGEVYTLGQGEIKPVEGSEAFFNCFGKHND